MAKLVFDATTKRFFETGVRNGVLFVQDSTGAYGAGVAWNGLTKVTEKPDGAEEQAKYADDMKYLSLFSAENMKLTLEAYTYPDEFAACDGMAAPETAPGVFIGQQNRTPFGLVYKTAIGNDVQGSDYAYMLHILYGAKASPSERGYEAINETPDAISLSWDLTTTPVDVPNLKPTALIRIDSRTADPTALAALIGKLYGIDGESGVGTDPSLPLPSEIITLMKKSA
ncbi:hypothetical protein [Liquorilactobacillus hordei]|uniref:hypothetical protein n=1 Tax=Liquorilactobacillus hordei TaxID=468911 RepID=UPI0039E815E4